MSIFSDIGVMFGLKKPVAKGFVSDDDDILNTKKALLSIGHYKMGDGGLTPKPDNGLYDGLKKFQSQNNLKVDGIMKPGGPTAGALGSILGKLMQPKPSFVEEVAQKTRPPGSIIADDNKGTSNNKKPCWQSQKVPVADNADVSDNARALKALLGYANNGEHPRWIAEDIAGGHKPSIGKLGDLLIQLEAVDPKRAEMYHNDVMKRLPKHKQTMLLAFADDGGNLTGKSGKATLLDRAGKDRMEPVKLPYNKQTLAQSSAIPKGSDEHTKVGMDVTKSDKPSIPRMPRYKAVGQDGKINWQTRVEPSDWKRFNETMHRMGLPETERKVYRDIYSHEGGSKKHETKNDGTSVSGITPQILEDLREDPIYRQAKNLNAIGVTADKKPSDLTMEQRIGVYGIYQDRLYGATAKKNGLKSGRELLGAIGDKDVASAIADTNFREGSKGGPEVIQKALNKLHETTGFGKSVMVDGVFGSETFRELKNISESPQERKQFLDLLADQRKKRRAEKIKPQSGREAMQRYKGESRRADYYRISR